MRRRERKRGTKVTRKGDPEGYSSEKTVLVKADGFEGPAGNTGTCAKVSADRHPGVSGRAEFPNGVSMATRETRYFVPGKRDNRRSSMNSKSGGMKWRESEAPIVAVKSGNADGAKGCRFGIAGRGNMP